MSIKRQSAGKWSAFGLNASGGFVPGVGYKLYTYEPGTTTAKATYQDSAGASSNTNPVVFDSRGEADIWFNGTYDLKLTTDTDVLIWTLSDFGAGEDTINYGNYNLVSDGGFEDDANGDGLPDQWTVTTYPTAGAGAGSAILDTTTQIEGASSLKFTSQGDGGGYAESAFFNVAELAILGLVWKMKSSIATVRNVVEVIWYTSAKVQISTSGIYDNSTTNPTSWTEKSGSATAVINARFAKIRVTGCHSSVATAGSTWFDDLYVIVNHTAGSNQILANNVFLQGKNTFGVDCILSGVNSSNQSVLGNGTLDTILQFAHYLGMGNATFNIITGGLYIAYGSYQNGTNWIATLAKSSIFNITKTGGCSLYYDSGLTIGNSFTPTAIFTIDGTGKITKGTSGQYVTAADYPVFSSTVLSFTVSITAATWTSIGPTGSGASVIWTALDTIPSDADWIEVRTLIGVSTTGTSIDEGIYVRASGSSVAINDTLNSINKVYTVVGGNGTNSISSSSVTSSKIQLSSSNIFEVYYKGVSAETVTMAIVGYGSN